MRGFQLRLLLALVLVLLGATVIVGVNLDDDDSTMALVRQTQPLCAHAEEEPLTSVRLSSSAQHLSPPDSEIAPRSSASVIDLVCVLRC
jgi:hypothetical protein